MTDKLTREQERLIRDLPSEWATRTDLDELPASSAEVLIALVRRYDYGESEIRILLETMFAHVARRAGAAGAERGHAQERASNPAIRAFGAALSDSLRAERRRMLGVITAAFDALTASGCNPLAAFNQARKAVEEKP